MNYLTGFVLQIDGVNVGPIYLDELEATREWKDTKEKHPDSKVYISRQLILTSEIQTTFGFKYAYGRWHLTRNTGMGEEDYFSLDDESAVIFAEAVFKHYDMKPGDKLKELTVDVLDELISRAKKMKEFIDG